MSGTLTAPDLTDVSLFVSQEHYRVFEQLRETDPVYWNETADGSGFWVLTKYDDIADAYNDSTLFTSTRGPMLGGSFGSVSEDTGANRMLVASDPPRHRVLRGIVKQVFSTRYVDRIEAQVAELVRAALRRALDDGGCDFAELAMELPAGALMVLMGVSHTDAHWLINATRRMIGFRDPFWVDTSTDERMRLAMLQADILDFFEEMVRERRREDREDLASVLLRSEIGNAGRGEDVLLNLMNVAVGGNETSSYTAAAAALALAEEPAELAALHADPSVITTLVPEAVRWGTTNLYVLRAATEETTMRGRTIAAGDAVTLWNVSANRDPEQFDEPDRFRAGRSPNQHLAYGVGIHRCIGAGVANIELTALFQLMHEMRVDLAVDGPVERLHSNFIQGISRLPLRVTTAA